MKQFDFPLFPPGKHRANDGTIVDLDFDVLQDLVRNTNFVIGKKILAHPPVGFRHPASQDRFAKGHIAEAKYINGVAHVFVNDPKFIADAKKGNLLEYSGEIGTVEYTEEGVPKKIGPVIVGLALLGDERPGIKDPRRKPLSQLVTEQAFGETLSPAQSWEIGEELRKAGVIAQTFDGDQYCFSEIEVPPTVFAEGETHMPLTADELKQIGELAGTAATTAANAAVKPLTDAITSMQADIKKFGEGEQRKSAARTHIENLRTTRKEKGAPLPAPYLEKAEKILSDPSFSETQLVEIRSLVESAPGAFVKPGNSDDDPEARKDDEPKAVAAVRPKHFAEMESPEAQVLISTGVQTFGEWKPEAFKGIENNPPAQVAKFRQHVFARDMGTTVTN